MNQLYGPLLMTVTVALTPLVARGAEFSWCGTETPVSPQLPPDQQVVEARVVFVKFPDDSTSLLPPWAGDLEEDIPEFIRAMTGFTVSATGDTIPGQELHLTIVRRPAPDAEFAWMAPEPSAYYTSGQGTHELNSAILSEIEVVYPDYWAGVHVVCMVYSQCTLSLFDINGECTTEGMAALHLLTRPLSLSSTAAGTMQLMKFHTSKESQEAIMAHEYLHLFRMNHPPLGVNYGRYDFMAGGQDGLEELEDGPLPVHPIELSEQSVGWADEPIPIVTSTLDLRIPDFFGNPLRSERKMFKIAMSTPPAPSRTIQSFLLANHQKTTPYDAKYLGSGLLIWHMLSGDQGEERARDLEVASGKFANGQPDPSHGCDSLEATSPPGEYVGSATDFFDGVTATDFSYHTNPNTNLYPSASYSCAQTELTDFAVENIRRDVESGDMLADIYLTRAQLIEAPNGGEEIERGSIVTVAWRVRSVVGYQDIDIAVSDDGATYRTIESGLPNSGAYSWHVLQKAGTYKLKLVSRDSLGNTWSDESDASFTITDSRVCTP